MKKIIALALALVLALSLGSVAFAAVDYNPGEKIYVPGYDNFTAAQKSNLKVTYDFTSSANDYKGASMIESVEWEKDAADSATIGVPVYDLVITLKENLTSTTEKTINGVIKVYDKTTKVTTPSYIANQVVGNEVKYIAGEKKADAAEDIWNLMAKNNVLFAEDGAGYVKFDNTDSLVGTVKVAKDEKAQVYVLDKAQTKAADVDLYDAIDEYLGEDYDGIVEWYNFCGTGFKADVDFQYDAYAEDPHYFYQWDGEKFVDLKATFNDDEDVEKYEFTAPAKGLIIVTDTEIVAAAEEETKNPDTGANDVVGVAAALAVVSLVAAGAVALKK